MRAKKLLLSGIFVALTLSVAATLPYVLTLWSLNLKKGEMNFAAVAGETHMHYQSDSLVNITLVAVYPKAAVEAYDMFVAHFVFLIKLDADVTWFYCDEIEFYFRSLNWTSDVPTYSGSKTLSHYDRTLENLSRYSASGRIQPFVANVSLNVKGGTQDFSGLLHLASEVETSPNARLGGRVTAANNSFGSLSVLFDMEKCPITIYRFNFLPLWFAYGISLAVLGLTSLSAYTRHVDEVAKAEQISSAS